MAPPGAEGGGKDGSASDGDAAPPPSDGGITDGGPLPPTCHPFDQPSTAALRASSKKVFGFYYPPFPISIENANPSNDYWHRWLSPTGGNGEYAAIGGLMRDRPLPRPPLSGNFRQLDFETEVRRAIAAGIDGFVYEALVVAASACVPGGP